MRAPFESLHNEIVGSLNGLTEEQTQLRPTDSKDKWTIQQIMEHLLLTYSSTASVVRQRLEKGRPTLSVPTLLQRCQQAVVIRAGYFPKGRHAPPMVTPEAAYQPLSGAMLSERVRKHLEACDTVLEDAEERFGVIRVATHHVMGSLTAEQWRQFHLVHGRHHVKQIWAIRRSHQV